MPDTPDKPTARKTLYLIDGHAQFFRAYYAIRSAMSSPVTKEPTNLTFGFVGMLIKLLREYRPDYLVVAIDVSGDKESFRSQIDPEYKAHREAPPDDFRPQVERCLEVLEQMRVPVVGQEGVEADDVIATLVRRLQREHPELDIRIVSKDKDLAQLLGEHVELLDVHTDRVVTAGDIFKHPDVRPEQVVDILALMGDTVDNIPGVEGVGPKTAAKLIEEYGSIENLLANLDRIKGKRRERLEAARERLPINLELVRLKEDVEVDLDLQQAAIDLATLPGEDLQATMRQLGFNRHSQDLRALLEGRGGDDAAAAAPPDSLFGVTAPAVSADRGTYEAVLTAEALEEVVDQARAAGQVAIDTETDGLGPRTASLSGFSLAFEAGRAWYVPVRSPQPQQHLDAREALQRLKPLLEDRSVVKVGHNMKFDRNVLRPHGVQIAGPCFDTMIASYVVDATRSSHRLDVLALALLDYTCTRLTDLIGTGRKQLGFHEVPLEQAVPYAAEDADVCLRIREILAAQMEAEGLVKLFDELEMPLVEVLADLEYTGIRVDRAELDRQRDHLAHRIEALRAKILEAAPHPFNPDSPKQLAVALFNRPDQDPPGLGLPVQKRGKTGPSTDQEVLEKLSVDQRVDSPVPGLVVEYRLLTKLVNTYLIALADAINPETGRIHASFNQTVAATGRLSASDPNLQNIPIRTEVGRQVRRAFVADHGCVLLTADYSQIELRLLAHLSGDPTLIEAFHRKADIHTAVAAEVFEVEPDQVTAEQRSAAKMVNFGIIYGITPWGLSRRLGPDVSVERARQIIDDYKGRFGRIEGFLAECVLTAQDRGYVETILGRRRAIPEARARHPQRRALGERMAINTVVQGSAADLIKLAMIDLHRRLPQRFPDARMVLQIHDELVFEVPAEQVEAVAPFVVERMAGAMDLEVDLVTETAWSESWVDAK
jgi:DNA polymerase-1